MTAAVAPTRGEAAATIAAIAGRRRIGSALEPSATRTASHEHGSGAELRLGEDGVVVAVDAERLAVLGSPRTAGSGGAAARRGRASSRSTAVGTSISPSHVRASERADRPAGLEHHPPVVLGDLLHAPTAPRWPPCAAGRTGAAAHEPGLRRRQPGEAARPPRPRNAEPLLPRGARSRPPSPPSTRPRHELAGGGATSAGRSCRPSSSRPGSTRSMPSRSHSADDVVGAVLEAERLARADAAAVAAVVEREHAGSARRAAA